MKSIRKPLNFLAKRILWFFKMINERRLRTAFIKALTYLEVNGVQKFTALGLGVDPFVYQDIVIKLIQYPSLILKKDLLSIYYQLNINIIK